ncbi:unnamed protein product, partial [Heterotrigona itama]
TAAVAKSVKQDVTRKWYDFADRISLIILAAKIYGDAMSIYILVCDYTCINNIRGPVDHISDLEIIGNYSINGEREYCSGIEQLKYYKKPLNSWIICASKFKGTIYLCCFDTEEKKLMELVKTNYEQKCADWGYKFEQYMLAGKKCELVELKTIHQHSISNYGPRSKFRNLSWWAQCYLAGIKKIVCGCKNDKGFVTEIKEVKTSTFHAKEKEKCKSFCSGFLEQVKTIVREDYDKCLYKFTYNPKKRIITVDKMKPDNESEYMFLYLWYTDNIKKQYKNKT